MKGAGRVSSESQPLQCYALYCFSSTLSLQSLTLQRITKEKCLQGSAPASQSGTNKGRYGDKEQWIDNRNRLLWKWIKSIKREEDWEQDGEDAQERQTMVTLTGKEYREGREFEMKGRIVTCWEFQEMFIIFNSINFTGEFAKVATMSYIYEWHLWE